MSKFAGLSLECVAAQAHLEVGKALGRALKHTTTGQSLSIGDQMKLLRESQMMVCNSSESQRRCADLQLMQNKLFHGVMVGFEMHGDLDVALVRRSDGSSCYLYLSSEFARLCADLLAPGRSIRWTARTSPPMIPGTLNPLFSPGESLALILKPHTSENDALMVDLLNVGDLGSACVATVVQIMQPQSCTKYRAGLIRVLLYIHNCCNSEGTTRSDCGGILLLWDNQHGIAALFEEGDTLLMQFPVWVSSYDADDVAGWGCGLANPILFEVGAQSVLFVQPAELQPVVLNLTARKLSLSTCHQENENTLVSQPLYLPINLHSCASARITAQNLRVPVAIVSDAAITENILCPRIEALDLTFVHSLPLPLLLCDAAAGMRGICCLVRILSCELVSLDSPATAKVAKESTRVIIHGGGRGSDLTVSRADGQSKENGINNRQYLYKISDGWGFCDLLLPLSVYNPSMLLHKTVLLDGFDCRELVARSGSSVCIEDSELRRHVLLMPHSSCRVLPITSNIGLALSAASHHRTYSAVIRAIQSLSGGKSKVAEPRVCLTSHFVWSPSHAVAATLSSVLEGTGGAGCSVVLLDKNNVKIQLPCSSFHLVHAVQLHPLVGSNVVCVLTLKSDGECVQVEGVYRC
jgi:hypothetical protein